VCQCEQVYVVALCDELPCVDGASIDGKCLCEDNSYGALCDVSSIVGFYSITAFVMEDCPSYVDQYNLSGNVDDGGVCGVTSFGRGICFANNLSINEDGTCFLLRSTIFEQEDGSQDTRFFRFNQGTYQAQNDQLIMNLDNGDIIAFTITEGKLTWVRPVEDGGDQCVWTDEYSLSLIHI